MNFLNKKIPLRIVIIILLIFVGVIGTIFYWQKSYVPPDILPLDILPEAVNAECLEDISKMSSEELIEKINILPFATGEDLKSINKQMVNYLTYKLKGDKNEGLYNKTRSFIEDLDMPEEKEQASLVRLDEAYSRGAIKDSFTLQTALGDLTEICPDRLPNLCLEDVVYFDIQEKERFIEDCNNICNSIDQYSKDRDILEEEVINNKEWIDNEIVYGKQYRYRTAMAYRFGGQDLALKICDNTDVSKREDCILWVDRISNLESETKNFNNIREKLEKLICQLPIDEVE